MRKIYLLAAFVLLVLALGVSAVLARSPEKAAERSPLLPAGDLVPAAIVLAQDPVEETTPETADPPGSPARGPGMGMMRAPMRGNGAGPMWGQGTALEIVAQVLGLGEEELSASLQGGATIASLAAQQGVELQTIVDALVEAHEAALQAAVEAGTFTAGDAALMQERMSQMWAGRLESGSFFGGRGAGNPDCPMFGGDGDFTPGSMPGQGMGRGMHGQGMGRGRGFGGGQGVGASD